ncbi:MAG: 4-(cytidine 5'-diphospho)-2-C-methyl-D-erythritol kinase [Chitinophagaceae bacterium]|nr:4-(cytidine 5'-diphospho)-2-C-methyl-D-erythritol kinase [Chitinophagaceae bacterium]
MLHFPNAKINLGLSVTEKRPDGYHNLETVFYPLPMLKDALEVLPARDGAASDMRISGKSIAGAVSQNLVWKALELLQTDFPEKVKPVSVHLLKTIPMGAGLGGGSADAAFMLQLLNRFFELELSQDALASYALQLGSDCPFFIYNTPHFAQGRGELLEPIPLDLSAYSLQLVCPRIHVRTASAFSDIVPGPAKFPLREIAALPLSSWKEHIVNDFETTVFKVHPELARIKQRLYDEGALYAAMSGTGSALYGLFEEGKQSSIADDEQAEVFYFH